MIDYSKTIPNIIISRKLSHYSNKNNEILSLRDKHYNVALLLGIDGAFDTGGCSFGFSV